MLDAGTGIRRLGSSLAGSLSRVDVLLSHLHLDHIQGLGFFGPLYQPRIEVGVWGPASATQSLGTRLTRYLSPPLFPVHLRTLPARVEFHDVPCGGFEIGSFRIRSAFVCHPGPTVGYRIESGGATLVYLPDHEPALGATELPRDPEWTSGHELAFGADLLIHDAQFDDREYSRHVGWGHSSIGHAIEFAARTSAAHLALFHHDPFHSDDTIDRLVAEAARAGSASLEVTAAMEGAVYEVEPRRVARV